MALKQKLAELVVDITAKLSPLKGQLAKANAMMKRGLASMVKMARRAGKWIAVGLVAALAWATRAAMTQESAELDLAAALRETGDATKENIAGLKKYAAELQKLTKYGDEEILAQMAYAKNLGVSTGQLQDAAKAAIGLAAKYKLELATAMMLVGRASQGQTQMLTRYGIVLDESLSAQEKFSAVLGIGAAAFGLAEEAAKSTRNTLVRLWNIIGDVAEKIAAPLLPQIREAAKAIGRWMEANAKMMASRFGEWLDFIAGAFSRIGRAFDAIRKSTTLTYFALAALAALIISPFLPGLVLLAKGLKYVVVGLVGFLVQAAKVVKLTRLMGGGLANFRTSGKLITGMFKSMNKVTRALFARFLFLRLALGRVVIAFKWATVAGKAAMVGMAGLWVILIAGAAAVGVLAGEIIKKLLVIRKGLKEIGKQKTFEERAAKAEATREERELKRKNKLLALEKKRRDAIKERAAKAAAAAKQEIEADKERLEATLAFLEKVGASARDVAKLKRDLLEVEAKETAKATEGDPLEIRRGLTRKALSLQRAADKEARDERRSEFREKLETLKTLFTGEYRYAKQLALIKKRLRYEEAVDIKKVAPWLDVQAITAMLAAKESPVEIAKAGLVGIESAWGQIATGAQRTQEEQLRALERIREGVDRQVEIAEQGRGMQPAGTPRY